MVKLINYKEIEPYDGFEFLVAFNRSPKTARYFNKFAEVLGSLSKSKLDLETGGWLVDDEGLRAFERLDQKLFPPKKTMKEEMKEVIQTKHKSVDGWEKVGIGMKLQPYDYQKQVVKYIVDGHNGSHDTLIVAPCGAGKTPMMISAYLECHYRGIIEGPGMIVVKASLKTQWAMEIKKFSGLRPKVVQTYKKCVAREEAMVKRREKKAKGLTGKALKEVEAEIKDIKGIIKRKFQEQFQDADIYVVNYETLNDEKVSKALLKIAPQFVASDESHYIKSDSTKRAKSLCKFNGAKVKIGATATPVQRDPRDIYGIFKFVHPELFVKKTDFCALYVRYGYGFRVIGAKNEKKLNEKIDPFMYILTKQEVADHLPKLVVSQRYCELSPKQKEVNDAFMAELDELHDKEMSLSKGMSEEQMKTDENVLAVQAAMSARQTYLQELTLSEKLLEDSPSQLAKQFVTGDPDQKIELMVDFVEEVIGSGEKVCIFSRFARMQPIIDEALLSSPELKNIDIAHVNGSMDDKQRYHEVYDRSRDEENCKVLVMTDAGAEGLNLGHIKYLIEMEPSESYAIQTQRHGRMERADSQHDTVYVVQFIAVDSWDEIGLKIIAKKEKFDMHIVKGVVEDE